MRNKTVLISGASIAGPALAYWLDRYGFNVTVVEKAPGLRPGGQAVDFKGRTHRTVLERMGVWEEIQRRRTGRFDTVYLDANGRELAVMTGEFTGGDVEILRGDVAAILHERTSGDCDYRFGDSITALAETADGVRAEFEHAAPQTFDLVVGADGIHSKLRARTLGAGKAAFTGCIAWRGVVPSDRLPAHLRRAVGANWVGPGRHVVTYPLRRGELVNFVGVVERQGWETESWTARGSRADCAADFAGWHEDVHALIDNIDEHYRWALMSRPPIERWSSGNVVLVGDACHPMLPFMAQGAVMAIEDGLLLARCIEAHRDDRAAAIRTYESLRVERANRCVRAADRNREIFHNDRLLDREDATRYVSTQWNEEKVRERYHWLFSYDAVGCPLES